jgi:hypothetical protein
MSNESEKGSDPKNKRDLTNKLLGHSSGNSKHFYALETSIASYDEQKLTNLVIEK